MRDLPTHICNIYNLHQHAISVHSLIKFEDNNCISSSSYLWVGYAGYVVCVKKNLMRSEVFII
jgi:hypothetical protein